MAQNNVAGARFCPDAKCGVNVLLVFALLRRFFSGFSLQILIRPGSKTSIKTSKGWCGFLIKFCNLFMYLFIGLSYRAAPKNNGDAFIVEC